MVLSYYARMRLTSNLLPVLLASPHPRVLSVLNGGKEKAFNTTDLNLDKSWSPFAAIGQTTTMTSLAFDYLSQKNPRVTFLHAFPGLVRTDISTHLVAPAGAGFFRRVWAAVLRIVVGTLLYLFGIAPEQSGERHAYQLTSGTFQPGSWRVNEYCDVVKSVGVLGKLRGAGWPEKIWEFTLGVFERAVAASGR